MNTLPSGGLLAKFYFGTAEVEGHALQPEHHTVKRHASHRTDFSSVFFPVSEGCMLLGPGPFSSGKAQSFDVSGLVSDEAGVSSGKHVSKRIQIAMLETLHSSCILWACSSFGGLRMEGEREREISVDLYPCR